MVDPFFNKVAPSREEGVAVDVGDVRGAVKYDMGRTLGCGTEGVYIGCIEGV